MRVKICKCFPLEILYKGKQFFFKFIDPYTKFQGETTYIKTLTFTIQKLTMDQKI